MLIIGMLNVPYVMAEDQAAGVSMSISNSSTPIAAPDGITLGPLTLVLESHTYYPNDVVKAFVFNATDPLMDVIDPAGLVYNVTLERVNESAFVGEYALNRSIILDNYTVVAFDNATGASVNDSFLVITRPVLASPEPEPTIEPANRTNETTEEQPLYLLVNTSKNDYPPMEQVDITVRTNAGTPTVVVQDPVNNTVGLKVKSVGNDTYVCAYKQDKAVVLGNYTVLAYVNENGVYNYTRTYFNVSMGSGGVSVDKGFRVQYAAYDPVQKAIVVRANVSATSSDAVAIVKDEPKLKGMNVKGVKVLGSSIIENGSKATGIKKEDKKIEVVIPVDSGNVDEVARQFNVTRDITKATTSVTVSEDGTRIHLSLNDKVDGCWYRMSAPVPDGYTVQKIIREDGVEIKNDIKINRSTGEYEKYEVNWYVENGTLYFYDDPINGYDITLLPPIASNSLALNVIYGGQLSAIIFPFNQTDSPDIIRSHDHLGRTEDGSYANDIDENAGSKTSIVINGNVYGNDPAQSNGVYRDIGNTIVGFNTVPDGSVESVIIYNFTTPLGVTPQVNITQKTIIRDNNLWFATVYYITNTHPSTNINNFNFIQGNDFNFNGQWTNDNCYYIAANDTVYGEHNTNDAAQIHIGGFRSTLPSSNHEASNYYREWVWWPWPPHWEGIWYDMAHNSLNGRDSYTGDGGVALQWSRSQLTHSQTWTVPIIWAMGQNESVFWSTLNEATYNKVYDIGIKEISAPANGSNLDKQTTPIVYINALAMDTGVTDVGLPDQQARVNLSIKYPNGTYYNTSTSVSMSIPFNETANVQFPWNISTLQPGMYIITIYTNLTNATGKYIDQNSANDAKTIIVYIRDFTLSPDQWVHANAGDNVLFPLNLSNLGTQRTFDLGISASTARWASNLYLNNTSTLIALDSDGDGTWDWVNASYRNPSSGLPAITVPAAARAPLLLQKLVPATADMGILDTVTLIAYPSGQPLTNSSAVLKTDTPLAPMANKTFYIHSLNLNTTPDQSTRSYTSISAIFRMWSQTPPFADSFTIAGNISIPIYYNSTSTMPITVTLFYTNGMNSVLIGSNTSSVPAYNYQTPTLFTFTIAPTNGNVTIPRGSYLVLKIDNQQTTSFNVWYTTANPSRIEVKTPTYIHIGSINTYNGVNQSTNFSTADTVYVNANVSDPIGSYDIWKANISINAPNGTYLVNDQSMVLNKTDPSTPSLWKLFNYSFPISSTLPPGVYGINVTAYESNGVIHRKNASFTITSGTPAILIHPNVTKICSPGSTLSFKHTITNLNAYLSDVADITYTRSQSWPVSLYKADGITPLPDTDGDGVPDTGMLAPLGSTDIIVRVNVPSYVTPGDIDTINVTARSSQDATIASIATDRALVETASVAKTLYLHRNNTAAFMNTSANNASLTSTDISNGASRTWEQTPPFARSFNILDDPSITLYAKSSGNAINMTVTLLSTDGMSTTPLGSIVYTTTVNPNTITPLNFNISLSTYNVTIPAGSRLQVKVQNNIASTLTISHTIQNQSRIDMNTQSYIDVISLDLLDQSNNPISSVTPPATIKVVANVTDPFGSYDIAGANITLYYENGTAAIGPLTMNVTQTDPSNPSLWKTFERNLSLTTGLDSGNYTFTVTGVESNLVTDNASRAIPIIYPINVTTSKSLSSTGVNTFQAAIRLTNNDNHTANGVYAYDFYSSGFTVSGFSCPRHSVPVNNGILAGNINVLGPFDLPPGQTIVITYSIQGSSDYGLSDLYVVGVDPYV